MTTTCLNVRISKSLKTKIKKVSVLAEHKNLTVYVVSVINEKSTAIIGLYESMTDENDVFDRFMEACDKA